LGLLHERVPISTTGTLSEPPRGLVGAGLTNVFGMDFLHSVFQRTNINRAPLRFNLAPEAPTDGQKKESTHSENSEAYCRVGIPALLLRTGQLSLVGTGYQQPACHRSRINLPAARPRESKNISCRILTIFKKFRSYSVILASREANSTALRGYQALAPPLRR
jgi:hypothetical protein